jgi:succinyl-diaminopimelate desuccinylase
MIDILSELVGCRSVTPSDCGAVEYCSGFLRSLGFSCEVLSFNGVNNLYARLGNSSKNLCFAGHLDVVPAVGAWTYPPFELTIVEGVAYGRGTNDMKGPLAACLAAIRDLVLTRSVPADLSLSVLLTSDEEIMGHDGMKSVIPFLKNRGEKITGCVLCESCSPTKAGEYIKIGCRGSLNIDLSSEGMQCHVANAPLFGNHLHTFIGKLDELCSRPLDNGNENFAPSSLQLTSIDAENEVRNIVPQTVKAFLNVRFNDFWTHESLEDYIRGAFEGATFERCGVPFIGASQGFIEKLRRSVSRTIGKEPDVGTDGGNSDALSIRDITEVVEIGSEIAYAHIVDEFINLSDVGRLHAVYTAIIVDF